MKGENEGKGAMSPKNNHYTSKIACGACAPPADHSARCKTGMYCFAKYERFVVSKLGSAVAWRA